MKKHAQMLLAMVFLFAFTNGILAAKKYRLDKISISAQVNIDGSLSIEEERSYSFRGSFKWADYQLPLNGIGPVRDFQLFENGKQYRSASNEEPGSYEMEQSEDDFYVRWYYRARNESRTFVLKYRVDNAITVYNDVAELFYKFVGEANKKTIGQVEVTLKLPEKAFHPTVRAWAHGPLNGRVDFDNGEIFFDVAPLERKTYWEVRVLFPKEWVTVARKKKAQNHLQQALEEEAIWAQEANTERQRIAERERFRKNNADFARNISIVLSVIGFGLFVLLFLRAGKPLSVPYDQKIDANIDPQWHPVLAGAEYFSRSVGGNVLAACLFNLADRGVLHIEQTEAHSNRWKQKFRVKVNRDKWRSMQGDLLDFENDMLSFYFDKLAGGSDTIDSKTIKKSRSKMQRWFRNWQQMVKNHFKGDPMLEKESKRATFTMALISTFIIIAGVFLLVFISDPGLIAIIAGVILFGLSFTILRESYGVRLMRKRLKALRNYLKNFHLPANQYQSNNGNMGRYLVFAIALGLNHKMISRMLDTLLQNDVVLFFPWYVAVMGANSSPADVAGSITSVIASTTATVSSAAGASGGASAGAGAGAGGASGGAG